MQRARSKQKQNYEDGSSMFLRNVDEFLPEYIASHLGENILIGYRCEKLKSDKEKYDGSK
jgi:hypothetical protein